MKRHGYISEEECEIAKSIPLKSLLVESESTTNQFQGFIDTVVEEVIDRTGKIHTKLQCQLKQQWLEKTRSN